MQGLMWKFETARFRVEWHISECSELDLSWCENDSELWRKINQGIYTAFDSTVAVYLDGVKIGADHMSESIYENPSDFRDHINRPGSKPDLYGGGYFSAMVREACRLARDHVATMPTLRPL